MRNKHNVKCIAYGRLNDLFNMASNEFSEYPERSHKYVKIALRLAAKAGISIPKKFRRNYCRGCKRYLSSGTNASFRTRNGKLIIRCFNCKKFRRIVLKPRI